MVCLAPLCHLLRELTARGTTVCVFASFRRPGDANVCQIAMQQGLYYEFLPRQRLY